MVAAPEKGAAASSAHVPLCQDEEEEDDDQEAMVRVLIQLKDWHERSNSGSVSSEEMEPIPALIKTESTEKLDTVGNLTANVYYVFLDGASPFANPLRVFQSWIYLAAKADLWTHFYVGNLLLSVLYCVSFHVSLDKAIDNIFILEWTAKKLIEYFCSIINVIMV